jgi:hypothetical protein
MVAAGQAGHPVPQRWQRAGHLRPGGRAGCLHGLLNKVCRVGQVLCWNRPERDQPADRVLGEHPQVHAMKWDSRFLVDPGGFEDLARALTVAYTPYHPDDALGRLAWLLNVR